MSQIFNLYEKGFSIDKTLCNLHEPRYHCCQMHLSANLRTVLIHVLIWFIYITLELAVVLAMKVSAPAFHYFAFYFFNIIFFYGSAMTFSRIDNTRYQTLKITLSFILLLLTYSILIFLVDYTISGQPTTIFIIRFINAGIFLTAWRGFMYIALGLGYFFAKKSNQTTKSVAAAEIRAAIAERNIANLRTAVLQAQLNPHLMLNMLNQVLSSEMQSEAAHGFSAKSVETLSMIADSMTYAIQPIDERGMIELAVERDRVVNLLALYKSLYHERLYATVVLNLSPDSLGKSVRALIIPTIIENVFKHGIVTDPGRPATIVLITEQRVLHLKTENYKRPGVFITSHGLGLKNIQNIVDDAYGGHATLITRDEGERFTVDLKIPL